MPTLLTHMHVVFVLRALVVVALAAVVLFAGYGIKRRVPLLTRYNIPAPVVGGLLVAAILSVAQTRGVTLLQFDTTLQTPLQNAFFASVGFGASLALLRVGGSAHQHRADEHQQAVG